MRFFIAICCIWCSQASLAAASEALYHVDIQLNTTTTAELPPLTRAMQKMLTKLTGQTDVALPKPKQIKQYVKQYHKSTQQENNTLSVQFDPKAVDSWLAAHNTSPWLNKRPNLLVWVALMTDNSQSLLGNDSVEPIVQALKENATMKGLPILLPELDLDDLDKVSFDDVWNHHQSAINEASERYESDGVLSVQIIALDKERFQALWRLKTSTEIAQWQVNAESVSALIEQGLAGALPYLKFEQTTIKPHQVALEISQIQSAKHYTELLDFLQQLDGINQVELDNVTGHSVMVKLNVSLSTASLRSLLATHKSLRLDDEQASNDDILYYQLIA